MDWADVHPVVRDVFKREAVYAALKAIGIPEEHRARWVVTYRILEPVLKSQGEEAARAMAESYNLEPDVLLLEIPEITDLRMVTIYDQPHVACTILGEHYTAMQPEYEEWGRAPAA